jgi:hypothetical protein
MMRPGFLGPVTWRASGVSEIAIATTVCLSVLAGALFGMSLRRVIPAEHMSEQARNIVNIAIGLIATLSALVLGLLVASAKSAFDSRNDEIKQSAARLVVLDRTLRQYGSETKDIRALLLELTQRRIDHTWNKGEPRDHVRIVREDASSMEIIRSHLWRLAPATDAQRWLHARALTLTAEIEQGRWLLVEGDQSSIPRPFLVVLASWIAVIFAGLGLFSPRNPTVYGVLLICAVAVSTAVLMILEMDQPFEGFLQVPPTPLLSAVEEMRR